MDTVSTKQTELSPPGMLVPSDSEGGGGGGTKKKRRVIKKKVGHTKSTSVRGVDSILPNRPEPETDCDGANTKNENSNDTITKPTGSIEQDDLKNYIEEPWDILGSYFEGKHLRQLVRHQIESYNDFVSYQIQRTISMFNPVNISSEQDFVKEAGKHSLDIQVTFDKFSVYHPQIHENNGATKIMFPHEARLRNFTYASNMTVDMNVKYTIRSGVKLDSEQIFYKVFPGINIGKLPIMLKSCICVLEQYKNVPQNNSNGECIMDTGGYFIINGSEKTCLGQERITENIIHCFNISKNNNKWAWSAEIRSVPDNKCISPKQISVLISSKNNGMGNSIFIQIPRIKNPIPIFILFRALGVTSDREICKMIVLHESDSEKSREFMLALRASILEANTILDKESALKFITGHAIYTLRNNIDKEIGSRKKIEFTMEVLNNDLFPHCKTQEQRLYFLGYMINELLRCSFGYRPQDSSRNSNDFKLLQ